MPVRRCSRAATVVLVAMMLTGCREGTDGSEGSVPAVEDPGPVVTSSLRRDVDRVMLLHFSGAPGRDGVLVEVDNAWQASFDIDQATWGEGQVRSVRSLDGRGARFPSFEQGEGPYAMLRVSNIGTEDPLSPGEDDFSFGADVLLDEASAGSDGDNGDNVMQRGLFEEPAQYKLQVDRGRPSCRVAGLGGEVVVSADERLRPGSWYRVRCLRRTDHVRLEVSLLTEDGVTGWSRVTGRGQTGALVMPRETVLSIGGKLSRSGQVIPTTTDQFNGVLDRVFIRRSE